MGTVEFYTGVSLKQLQEVVNLLGSLNLKILQRKYVMGATNVAETGKDCSLSKWLSTRLNLHQFALLGPTLVWTTQDHLKLKEKSTRGADPSAG